DLCGRVRAALKARVRASRQSMPGNLQVPVDCVANPNRGVAGRNRARDDIVNLGVAPALRKGAALGVTGNVERVSMKLDGGFDGVRSCSADAFTYQELVRQRLARIDRKPRRNINVEGVRCDVCVVAEVDLEIEAGLCKRAPERPLLAVEKGSANLKPSQHLR